MFKIKCCKCGKSDVFENEKHAYMAGWFFPDGRKQGFGIIEICEKCQTKAPVAEIYNKYEESDNE